MRMAPNPSRFTVKSPPIVNVPLAFALIVAVLMRVRFSAFRDCFGNWAECRYPHALSFFSASGGILIIAPDRKSGPRGLTMLVNSNLDFDLCFMSRA
jgi:hypothetical protein